MKTDFKFSNLLGTVYGNGNLEYSVDGNTLISPVGNRISVFDLVKHVLNLVSPSSASNSILKLNPQGNLLLSVDVDGRAILGHFSRKFALYHFSFRDKVDSLQFSPSGSHFAVGTGGKIEVWLSPFSPDQGVEDAVQFSPFILLRTYAGHFDNIRSITWSSDSRFFLTASKDLTARIWSLRPEDGFTPTALAGHRQAIVGAWFTKDQEIIYSVSADGVVFRWEFATAKPPAAISHRPDGNDETRWRIMQTYFFHQAGAKVTCATFHTGSNLLIAGFSTGVFTIHDLPDFAMLQKLSISQHHVNTVSINKQSELIAFGASKLGQLLVWEWQSESYVLKQQAHYDAINAVTYTSDGQRVITAADDGKVKIWDVKSGFCVVTFTQHTGGVTACAVAKRSNVLFTASLDGSVRAWDLIRYRNFRTFAAPTRLSFSSLAVDPSGEVVVAGSIDSFDIQVWSVQTGQLLDQLTGHEGPVSTLAFAPNGNFLASGSWDRTVRIWNIFSRSQSSEPLQLQADVLCIQVRPDSRQIAVSTLDGQLTFWSVDEAVNQSLIDGRPDISGGRKTTDRRIAANVASTKSFNTIVYSADGSCVLAAGRSKYICLYDVESAVLLKKFTVSINLSLEGTQKFLNSKQLTEAGPAGLIDALEEGSDQDDRNDTSLPGVKKGDAAAREVKAEVRVSAIIMSPTGQAFCCASTEGLLVYSLDSAAQFEPIDLDLDITPSTTIQALQQKDYARALAMGFRLNDQGLLRHIYESVPPTDISLTARGLTSTYTARLLRLVATMAEENAHLEFNLMWIKAVLDAHGKHLRENAGQYAPEMRQVQSQITRIQRELTSLADNNTYMMEYLLSQAQNSNGKLVDSNGFESQENVDMSVIDSGPDAVFSDEGSWLGVD